METATSVPARVEKQRREKVKALFGKSPPTRFPIIYKKNTKRNNPYKISKKICYQSLLVRSQIPFIRHFKPNPIGMKSET